MVKLKINELLFYCSLLIGANLVLLEKDYIKSV